MIGGYFQSRTGSVYGQIDEDNVYHQISRIPGSSYFWGFVKFITHEVTAAKNKETVKNRIYVYSVHAFNLDFFFKVLYLLNIN